MCIGNVEHKERINNKTAMRVYFIRIGNAEYKERINSETAMRFTIYGLGMQSTKRE